MPQEPTYPPPGAVKPPAPPAPPAPELPVQPIRLSVELRMSAALSRKLQRTPPDPLREYLEKCLADYFIAEEEQDQ